REREKLREAERVAMVAIFAVLALPLSTALVVMVVRLVSQEYGPTCCGWGTFGMHAIFMTLAFGMFAPLSALTFLPRFGLSRDFAKKVHMVGHGCAVAFACLGVAVEWKLHSGPGSHHLSSSHSWIGICTVVAYITNWMSGLSFALPSALAPRPACKRTLLPVHVFLGSVALVAGLLSIVTGLLSHLRRKAHHGEWRWWIANWASILAVCLGVVVFGGLYRPFRPQEEVQKEDAESSSDHAHLESGSEES
ncbi:unnamed protein product, partial [Effrenium voratum]